MTVSSPLGIGGLAFIGIGLALAIAGIVLLIAKQNKPKDWYVWFLISFGTLMGIIGGVMLAIALADTSTLTKTAPTKQLDKTIMDADTDGDTD